MGPTSPMTNLQRALRTEPAIPIVASSQDVPEAVQFHAASVPELPADLRRAAKRGAAHVQIRHDEDAGLQ